MKIFFKQREAEILINGTPYVVKDHCVETHLKEGWQLLKLQTNHSHIKITNMELDGQLLDHLMLVMFDQNHNCNFGDLFGGMRYFMPIHQSYAHFKARVSQDLTNGWYGKQIYEHFDFVIDRPIQFQTEQPTHIQEYFAIDTGAHWLRRHDSATAWFFDDPMNVNKLKLINSDLFEIDTPGGDTNEGWTMRNIKQPTTQSLKDMGLGTLADIAEQKKFTSMTTVSCNTLAPGGHIGIHKDGNIDKTPRKKIYYNLDPSDGVYFKFATVGLVPMNTDRGIWVNTDQHVHAVVNDTDQPRTIVSISGQADW